MSEPTREQFQAAVRDFRQARRRAAMEQLLARLSGRNVDLLSYDDVSTALRAGEKVERGVQEVPLDVIVGSVGRFADFTRDFLPKSDSGEERWARMRTHMLSGYPIAPVELYKIGDAFFVIDGNHRVSVSREMGASTIQAHVTEVRTAVPLSPDDDVEDIVCRVRLREFLDRSGLDKSRPDVDFAMTLSGRYHFLEEQIARHQLIQQQKVNRPVPFATAARHWCDRDYLPAVELIRRQDLLRDFPDRTETDLYVWIMRHRQELSEELGWTPDAEHVVDDLAQQYGTRPAKRLARLGGRLAQAMAPDRLFGGPPAGEWRRAWLAQRRQEQLFVDVLLILSDIDRGNAAQRLGLEIARREEAEIFCVYVATEPAQLEDMATGRTKAAFEAAAALAGISADCQAEIADPDRTVARSRWVDLVVAEVTNPPGPNPMSKLSSRFHNLLQRCPRPVLAVPPQTDSNLSSILLAYDDSSKAREALYVSAYLAGSWGIPLAVLHVGTLGGPDAPPLVAARRYLEERAVVARYIQRAGPGGSTIVSTARDLGCDLIAMGGFSSRPLLELVLGSAVEQVLQEAECPVLVCR